MTSMMTTFFPLCTKVAIDITGAAEHLLASRAAAELGAAASAATHLADSALSVDAAKVTRSSARQGHDKQQSRCGGVGQLRVDACRRVGGML